MTPEQLKKMTKEEMMEFITQQAKNDASGLTVKLTEKGGVYIKHSSFVEHSTTKDKDYVAGINLGFVTARALFGNPALLEQVRQSVLKLTK